MFVFPAMCSVIPGWFEKPLYFCLTNQIYICMYPKFIINQGRLIIGMVDQHKELADNHSTTQGGGWWHKDEESKSIWLYARSLLFGSVPRKVLQKVIASGNHDYPGYTFYYSRSSNVETAMAEGDKLG